jgi:hypothetical protein
MPNGAARGKGASGAGGGGGGGGKGAVGGGGGQDGGRWTCRICQLADNFAWRTRCRGCESYRVRGEGGPLSSSAPPRGPSLAERQVQLQRQAQRQQRASSAAERKLQAEVERLQQQLAAAQACPRAEHASARADVDEGGEGDPEAMDTADDYSAWTEEERRQQVDAARACLPYLVSKHGESSAEATNVREEIAALEKASRDSKPFKTHRAMLERKRDKLRARLKKDEEDLAKAEKEHEELKARMEEIRAGTAERSRDLASVEEELAELIKRALAEGDAAGEAGKTDDGGMAAWSAQAASATLQSLATRPGIPPELAALLAHVHQAVAAMAAAAAAAKPQQPPEGAAAAATKGSGPPSAIPAEASGGTVAGTASAASGAQQSGQQGQQGGGAAAAADPAVAAQLAAVDKSGGGGAVRAPAEPEAPANKESDEELVEADQGGAMDCDVEETLQRLPSHDQAKLRAAIRRGGWRGRAGGGGEGSQGAGREREDRERSPRPTKQSEDGL